MHRSRTPLLFASLATACVGATSPTPPAPAPPPESTVSSPHTIPVASVRVTSGPLLSLVTGTTHQLIAVLLDNEGSQLTGRVVTWSSSAETVASVSATGVLTAVSPGEAQISATSEGTTGHVTVTVILAPVAAVTLSTGEASLVPGEPLQLSATTRDALGHPLALRSIDWSTSAHAVATVTPSGLVTGVGVGVATITATSEGRSSSATMTVLDGGWVTPAGGLVTAAAGDVVLEVPAGALESPTAITVMSVTEPAGSAIVPGTTYEFGPAGTQFHHPVTMWIRYRAGSEPPGSNPLLYRIRQWQSQAWAGLPSRSTTVLTTRTTSVQITSLDRYGIGFQPVPSDAVVARVNPPHVSLMLGQNWRLSSTFLDENGMALPGLEGSWVSSVPTIASVAPDTGGTALVTALSPGLTTVAVSLQTVWFQSVSAGATITVAPISPPPPEPPPPPPPQGPIAVASITLSAEADTLVPAETMQVTSTLRDAHGNELTGRIIVWTSSAPAVASVSGTGLVTAASVGVAQITATSEGKSAHAVLTVAEGGFIGPSGGSVSAVNGDVRLKVPPGALVAGTAIRVSRATGVPTDPRVLLNTAITLSPLSTEFASRAILALRYPGGVASNLVPGLRLGRLVAGTWRPLEAADQADQPVSGALDSLGTYAIMRPEYTLRDLARGTFRVGAAVNPDQLSRPDPRYREVLSTEFNAVVAENVLKFEAIHPGPDSYAFAAADALVAFAEQNGMAVHGHTLLWHEQQPAWITGGTWTRATLLAALKSHVETVVGRYRGRIESWDVANEVVAESGDGTATSNGLRNSFWIQIIGPDVIDSAFAWAARADPNAKLYLNDFAIEDPLNDATKMNRVRALAVRLRDAGIPIHGIGLQGHFGLNAPSRVQLGETVAFFSRAGGGGNPSGFEVRFSELDVRIPDEGPPEDLHKQAAIYYDVVAACRENAWCRGVTTWGFSDKDSWIPAYFPGFGRALPFDANYQPKPAYRAMRGALQGIP